MSLKTWTTCIVSTLLAVALTSYLLADEPTAPEAVRQTSENVDASQDAPSRAEAGEPNGPLTQEEFLADYSRKLEEARQLVDSGQYLEAIERLQKLLSLARNPRVNLLLGRSFEAIKEYDSALQHFSTVMVIPGAQADDDLLAEAFRARGSLYLRLGRHREALDDFVQGARIAPLNAQMLYGRGLAQLELIRHSPPDASVSTATLNNAILSFDRAIQINDRFALAYYDRGMAKAMLGQEAGARKDLARAVEVDDENELTQRLANLTVDLLLENKELKESLSKLEAEAAEVAEARDDFRGQVSEMVNTLRQIRDLLAAPRGQANIDTAGADEKLNQGGFF